MLIELYLKYREDVLTSQRQFKNNIEKREQSLAGNQENDILKIHFLSRYYCMREGYFKEYSLFLLVRCHYHFLSLNISNLTAFSDSQMFYFVHILSL